MESQSTLRSHLRPYTADCECWCACCSKGLCGCTTTSTFSLLYTFVAPSGISSRTLAGSAAPVHVHLHANDEVQCEREREASHHEWIVHLLRSGEQSCGATRDLRDDGKGGELPVLRVWWFCAI